MQSLNSNLGFPIPSLRTSIGGFKTNSNNPLIANPNVVGATNQKQNAKKSKSKSKSKGASHRDNKNSNNNNNRGLLSDGFNIGGMPVQQQQQQPHNAKNGKNAAGIIKGGAAVAQLPEVPKKTGYQL